MPLFPQEKFEKTEKMNFLYDGKSFFFSFFVGNDLVRGLSRKCWTFEELKIHQIKFLAYWLAGHSPNKL